MKTAYPTDPQQLIRADWSLFAPAYATLEQTSLTQSNLAEWLADWTAVATAMEEMQCRLYVATSVNTNDKEAEELLMRFLDEIYPKWEQHEHNLKTKLLESGLSLEGLEVSLKKLRATAEVFCAANLPLQTQEAKLGQDYDKMIGAQTVEWDGETITLSRLAQVQQSHDRALREKAFRLDMERRLADRQTQNDLWVRFLDNRIVQAQNLGLGTDYRAFVWKRTCRFDYTPDNCREFAAAIEEVVVPEAKKIMARRAARLGVDKLRPWDTDAPTPGEAPLQPYDTVEEFSSKAGAMLHKVDPELGAYYDTMQREGLLDLDNRPGKAPGGYCTGFPQAKRPFIFMNGVGVHRDVVTLLHEAGHAFHVFEGAVQPYSIQHHVGSEFAEVASMSMELLASPYLTTEHGGYYSKKDAAKARIEHLEKMLLFWPYMAVVDQFQHWVYEHVDAARDAAQCDAKWTELWHRFHPAVDYSGLEDWVATGWHRKLHIFQVPFYYVEYGLAQLGAIQVWANSLSDQAGAVRSYRHALSLSGTQSLPDLFSAAGANFAFDAGTLRKATELCSRTIDDLLTQV